MRYIKGNLFADYYLKILKISLDKFYNIFIYKFILFIKFYLYIK